MTATGSTLAPQHLALLRASSISEDVADARGYVTITNPMQLHEWTYAGYQCKTPGLLLPVHTVGGETDGSFYRPDNPRIDAHDRVIKYEAPAGQRMHLDVPPAVFSHLGHPTEPMAITEGARKADAAVSHGLDCISIGGVWSWRGRNELDGLTALGDWENVHLRGRTFYLIFDSDVLEKRGVNLALNRLKRFLDSRDARVRICYLPPGDGTKMGLDDYLAAGGGIAELLARATVDLVITPFQIAVNGNGHIAEKLPVELDPDRPHLTDIGNGKRLIARHGHDLRYCFAWGQWLVWMGTHWERDDGPLAEGRAKETVLNLYRDAATEMDVQRRGEVIEHAKRSERRERISAMVSFARSEPGVKVDASEFDTNHWLYNGQSGTLNLKTGEMSTPRREDLLTISAPVPYDSHALCPTWEAFLAQVLPDPEVREFVQRAAGYSLTGDTSEQCLFLLYGTGANGKSTFLEMLRAAIGPYGETTDFQTFLAKDRDTIRNDLAKLRAARFVSASEVGASGRLDEAVVKQVTGGDTITARFLNKEYFDFRPQFKIWLAANHKPLIKGTEHAIWRRIHLVPFTVTIPPEQQDPTLRDRLIDELPGILAWIVRGCEDWRARRLRPPDGVRAATNSYREESDPLAAWIEHSCVIDLQAFQSASELYRSYEQYAQNSGEEPIAQTTFGLRLNERGIQKRKGGHKNTVGRQGIRLRFEDEAQNADSCSDSSGQLRTGVPVNPSYTPRVEHLSGNLSALSALSASSNGTTNRTECHKCGAEIATVAIGLCPDCGVERCSCGACAPGCDGLLPVVWP